MTDHRTTTTTHYRVEWTLPNGEVRYNEAEIYETMTAATIAAEQIKNELAAFRLTRLSLAQNGLICGPVLDATYRIVTVQVRRTVREG